MSDHVKSKQGRWRLTIDIDFDVKGGRSAVAVYEQICRHIEAIHPEVRAKTGRYNFRHHSMLPARQQPRSKAKP